MAKSQSQKKLFLIDASSLIFRAFFAIRGLSTSKGMPTNAVYGFTTMLLGVLEKYKPDYVACVFDTPKPTFRKEIYPDYKANRGAPPDDLVPQFELIHRCVESLGIKKLAEPGFEADDLIATLSRKFEDCEILIVTGDKDLMQLVNDRVKVLDTMKNITYGPAEVKEKLGVEPEQVTDYLGLIGDSSDNIPGVPGVGPKTAVELLDEYKTLEKVLAGVLQMKAGRRRELLIQHAEQARLSKRLATVHVDVGGCCGEVQLSELHAPTGAGLEFLAFLNEMEFKTLAKKYSEQASPESLKAAGEMISGAAAAGVAGPQGEESGEAPRVAIVSPGAPQVTIVANTKEWRECLQKLEREPLLAFDTETRGDRTTELEMVGMSLCGDGKESFYIPVRHQGDGTSEQLSVKQLLDDFDKLARGKTLIAQNLKYDYKVLLVEGHEPEMPQGGYFDTMLAHYLVDPEEKHGLDALAQRYLNVTVGDFKEVLGERPDFSLVPLSEAAKYGAMDAWSTRLLHEPLEAELKRHELTRLFREIEMPTAIVLAHMERNGVAVDTAVLTELSKEYAVELKEIEKDIFDTVGAPFNLNSPKQLSEILFNKLGLPVIQKTKTGYSTDVSVLQKLAPMHPVPALIVRYRELTKLKSTYVDVLPSLIEKDGRVHASFNQAVTATGRLSSSDPNLQNIPIKTESGRKIRRAFVAGRGRCLVGADYSQIELRLIAHLSGDQALIDAFNSKVDVHRATAAEIFHVKPDEVNDRQRGAAKAINFGLIYGKTAFGLAQELGISRTEAQQYIDAYFKRYSGVKRYMEQTLIQARERRYVETLFGRKRPIKDIENRNVAVRNNAERMAMNAPVQGTAADLMKLAMIKAYETSKKSGAQVVLQVHDELLLDVEKSDAESALRSLRADMEGVAELSVPLVVEGGIAESWIDL